MYQDEEGFTGSKQWDSLPSLQLDLNSNDSIKLLARFAEFLARAAEKAVVENDPNGFWSRVTDSISKKIGIYMPCDGNPTYALIVLRRCFPELFKHCKESRGGFHSMNDHICQKNKLSKQVHLGDSIKPWRKSEGQQKYFIKPSDPN